MGEVWARGAPHRKPGLRMGHGQFMDPRNGRLYLISRFADGLTGICARWMLDA